MATIDERVVAMSFENSKFESGIATTMASLNKLDATLANVGKSSGLSNIEAEANRISFSGLTSSISNVASHFSIIAGAASVALGSIAAKAAQAGAGLVKSLSIGPIIDGFHNYETQINAVQTIVANTGLTGAAGLQKVNGVLQELNTYANQTVYNFSEMAKNIGTFTAAGVDLQTAADSIKGIANLAALSGSNSQQASTAMYQLSQAIAAGTVHLQDWNSVVNAGMGGEVFQKALFNTAKAMGTLTNVPVSQTFEEWKKAGNSFRQSLSTTAQEGAKSADVVKKAQQDAAKTVASAQSAAADSIQAASQRVKDAQSGVADQARQSAADIASAVQAQNDTIKKSAADVKDALDGVREARKRLAEAMKPPSQDELQAASDNLKTAQLDQADLSDAVTQAQQEQTRSAQDLASAQAKLAALQRTPGTTPDQIQAAQRAVEDAQKRVTDAADAQTRALLQQRGATRDVDQAEKDLQTTREKGTKKDQNVKDARDALTVATQKYKDTQVKAQQDIAAAADQVTEAQRKSAESQAKANQRLADSEKDQAKTIVDAQTRIADAHTAAAQKINAARDSISKKPPTSWLTSDVLTSTLQQFTGDLSDAQLKAKGFTDEQIKAIQAQAKVAVGAATNIKTVTQLMQALKEEVGTAWASVFKTLFGDIGQATSLFSGIHIVIENALTKPVYAFNKVLQDWAKLGGRKDLFAGISAGLKVLGQIIKPIHDAFRDIFPPATGKSLADATAKFRDFMESLKIGPKTADELRRTFEGFFAVLHIGWSIVKDVAKVIFDLLGVAGKGSGGFLEITASIGDFLVKVDKAVTSGGALTGFFKGLTTVLKLPLTLLGKIGGLIGGLFDGADPDKAQGVSDTMGSLTDDLKPLAGVLKIVSDAWDHLMGVFSKVGDAVTPVLSNIGDAIAHFGDIVAQGFNNANFDTLFAAVQTTLIGGIFLAIKKGLGSGVGVDFGGGMLEKLSKVFEGLTGNLKAMQQNVQANTLLQIAIAIGVLAAGIAILASINAKDLNKAMTAVAVGMGELVGAMALLSKASGSTAFYEMPFIAGSLILLATAITILAGAMKIFATMSWTDLAKGLTGVGGALVAVAAGVKLIGPDVILIGPGLVAVAIAMNLLAAAVKIFSTLSWEELGKGLLGVAGALTAIGIGLVGIGPSVLLVGPGLVITAAALVLLAGAVKLFGSMDLKTLGLGILGIAGALVAIGFAIQAIPPTVALQAAGLVILSIALAGIAASIALLGNLSIGTLVKGITAVAAALVVLGVGLTAMAGTLPGSVALLAAASALAILVPVLGLLGNMKWSTIFKGLAAIAISLGALAISGALAAPGLIALGIALLPLGLGMAAVAGAVYLFAKAIQIMGAEGSKAVAAVIVSLTALAVAAPKIVIDFLKGLLAIVSGIAELAPKILVALGVMIDTLIAFIITEAPKLAQAITVLITQILDVINDNAQPLIQAGFQLMINLLTGIAQNTPLVVAQVAAIVIGFLTALTAAAPQLVAAGVNFLTAFLKGITDHMSALVTTVASMIVSFVGAVASQLGKIAAAGANLMTKLIAAIVSYEARMIVAGVNIILSFFGGIAKQIPKIVDKGVEVVGALLSGISKALVKIVNKGADAVINFLNGIAEAIRTKGPELRAAGYNIANAIIDGMWDGIDELGQKIVDKVGDLLNSLPKAARKILGIHSPSTVFQEIGKNSMLGLAKGLDDNSGLVFRTASGVGEDTTTALAESMSQIPGSISNLDLNPVITPVMDMSNVEAGAKQIARLSSDQPTFLYASNSTGQAQAIQAQKGQGSILYRDLGPPTPTGPLVTFEQNNYSPESLSPTEVYRQTNNQLSQAKGALGFIYANDPTQKSNPASIH